MRAAAARVKSERGHCKWVHSRRKGFGARPDRHEPISFAFVLFVDHLGDGRIDRESIPFDVSLPDRAIRSPLMDCLIHREDGGELMGHTVIAVDPLVDLDALLVVNRDRAEGATRVIAHLIDDACKHCEEAAGLSRRKLSFTRWFARCSCCIG